MKELQAPLSVSAVTLVLDGEAAGQHPAADDFTAFALHARIGLLAHKDKESQLNVSDLIVTESDGSEVDHQYDVYKRLKAFLTGKHVKPPA